jgi:hypothetical protein
MTSGIYILANDVVFDQLVALLNSIEVNIGEDFPVCIVPYNDRLDLVRQEIQTRKNVSLFEDSESIAKWENFAEQIWQAHPTAMQTWQEKGVSGVNRMGMHRRFCCFDGSFDKFVYLDADILVMNSFESIFQQLDSHDFVVYDFQYKDPTHVYDVNSPKLLELFPESRISKEIFCAGLYGSKKNLFDDEKIDWLLSQLKNGEAEILYFNGPDQSILNYMVMKSGIASYNFSHHLPPTERTGCSVTSPHFEEQNFVLYDKGNRLTYLHYIGVSSSLFRKVCAGENLDFPYRELFLHYRYLHEPEKRPKFTTKPKPYNQPPTLTKKIFRKLGLTR